MKQADFQLFRVGFKILVVHSSGFKMTFADLASAQEWINQQIRWGRLA